jgi:hypothetical protein
MTAFRHPIAPALIVVAVLMAISSAAAAQSPRPPRTSGDIQAQVQKTAELQRQALQSLTDLGRAERLISNAYAELQTALSAMLITASGRKSPDPLLNLNEQRMRQALSHLQDASDMLKVNRPGAPVPQGREKGGELPETPPAGSQSNLGVVRNDLEQALRLTNSVLVF